VAVSEGTSAMVDVGGAACVDALALVRASAANVDWNADVQKIALGDIAAPCSSRGAQAGARRCATHVVVLDRIPGDHTAWIGNCH
jgi:hypothetical protein